MFACCYFYFRLQLPLIIIHITCILLSLRRTSAPIHLTSVFGVLGTQETSCILIAGLLERDIFDLYLPEFDKPWVIHLRETCCCSTNLCTWRPNTVYQNRSMRRYHRSQRHRLNVRASLAIKVMKSKLCNNMNNLWLILTMLLLNIFKPSKTHCWYAPFSPICLYFNAKFYNLLICILSCRFLYGMCGWIMEFA
jgi:hypothetical protein